MRTISRIAFVFIASTGLSLFPAISAAGDNDKPGDSALALRAFLDVVFSYAFQLQQPPFPDRPFTEKEKRLLAKAEKRLVTRLKDEGGISDPRFPLIIYAKRVDGTKLIAVEFMHRDASGKGFDRVGTIEDLEIRVDSSHRQMLLVAQKLHLRTPDGLELFVESKIWPLPLPADLGVFRAKGPQLLKRDDQPLTNEDKEFLKNGYKK